MQESILIKLIIIKLSKETHPVLVGRPLPPRLKSTDERNLPRRRWSWCLIPLKLVFRRCTWNTKLSPFATHKISKASIINNKYLRSIINRLFRLLSAFCFQLQLNEKMKLNWLKLKYMMWNVSMEEKERNKLNRLREEKNRKTVEWMNEWEWN